MMWFLRTSLLSTTAQRCSPVLELDCDKTAAYVTDEYVTGLDAAMGVAEPADCDVVLIAGDAAVDRYTELHDAVVNDDIELHLAYEATGEHRPDGSQQFVEPFRRSRRRLPRPRL